MPSLLQHNDEYVYNAIINEEHKQKNSTEYKPGPIYTWDSTEKIYKYSNILFPNKTYKKTFDPKSFMSRGDVIHFGNDDYRNNNKMIFDGKKLQHLYTEIDDYGSVPPNFECGDNEEEFNIADFEDIIDHNAINWLSKEKLKEIEIYEKDNKIFGKVTIKDKLWKIFLNISEDTTFDIGYSYINSRKFKCDIEDDNIKIKTKDNYLIKAKDDENINNLKSLILENNNVNIISYYFNKNKESSYNETSWFLYHIKNEINFNDVKKLPNFPLIWKSIHSESLILDKDKYDFNIKHCSSNPENIYIYEIIGYPITIELIKKDTNIVMKYVKDYINSIIENYDNINKRQACHRSSSCSLEIYL